MSAVIYGNWRTHGEGIDYGTASACVRAALDSGINTFDTADMYASGQAEEFIGRALGGLPRDQVCICTKVGLPTGPGPAERGLARERILASCRTSLRRLRTDYIDLYQAHRFDGDTPLEESISAFERLVRGGDVRWVGVSEWTPAQLREGQRLARQAGIRIVTNQPQYSMLWRVPEAEVMPACHDLGIGQLAYSPLAQGVLTGKYPPGRPPPAGSRAHPDSGGGSIQRYMSDELRSRVDSLRPIADQLGLSLAQLSISWVLRNPNIAAIIGAARPEQVAENARAARVRLGDATLRLIDGALGDLIERDPAKAGKPYEVMSRWRGRPT